MLTASAYIWTVPAANASLAVSCRNYLAGWWMCCHLSNHGAMAAEAVVFFNQSLAETFSYRRKRSGHLFKDAVLVGTAGSLHNK